MIIVIAKSQVIENVMTCKFAYIITKLDIIAIVCLFFIEFSNDTNLGSH